MAERVHVLVIVGAEGEDDAAKLVAEGALGDWAEVDGPDGYGFKIWARNYRAGDGRAMRFALTRAFEQGMPAAGNAAARLVDHFEPSCLAMCGVCAGRPERTNLGDVIIGTQLWQYDFGKLKKGEGGARVQLLPQGPRYPLLPLWKQAAERFVLPMHDQLVALRPRTLDDQMLWVLYELLNKRDPWNSTERAVMCADWPAVISDLLDRKLVKRQGKSARLTPAGRGHVSDVLLRTGDQLPPPPDWKIHAKPIGTGSSIVEWDEIWKRLEKQDREIHGLEMEATVIGKTAHVKGVPHMVVKGVMDYAVPGKNDGFRKFAARASAEVLFAFLRENLKLDASQHRVKLSPNTAQLPEDPSPATLLNARYEAVDFDHAACGELWGDLQSWCASPESVSVRLFVGPGGSGKTRLFIQLGKELCERDWQAGFWPDGASPEDLETLLGTQRETLVVLDYAEARADLLELLRRAAQSRGDGGGSKLRMVLLAREVADWWKAVKEQDENVNDLLIREQVVAVAPVPLEGALRQRMFEKARDQFAERRGIPAPTRAVDLSDERFGRLLYLQLGALAVVDGFEELGADELLYGAVTHEMHFWQRRFSEAHGTMDDALVFLEQAGRSVAAVTLRGRADTFEDAQRINEWADGPQTAGDVFLRFLHRLYPGKPVENGTLFYLIGLEPDLLGEQLICRVLSNPHTSSAYLANILQDDHPAALFQAFVVLGRLSLREGRAIAWMEKALDAGDINTCGKPAFIAAMSLGDQSAFGELGRLLATRLSEQGSVELAEFVDRAAPEQTVSLRELCAWATQRRLDATPVDSSDESTLAERARLCNNLGKRLSELGKREKALDATREAVKHYRKLTGSRPDAFLSFLALSLNSLGQSLSELGRRKEGLEATQESIDIRRRLADADPDAFLPALAASLINLAADLSAFGIHEEALDAAREAVELYRQVDAARPGTFRLELATSLINLGAGLREVGRGADALNATRESVEQFRTLAKSRPDAFLPHLARGLSSLCTMLADIGRCKDALDVGREAVENYRRLDEVRPDVFLPNLALSLNNLGGALRDLGQREEALEVAREALDIRRRLAEARPDAFLPDFANSLKNLGMLLSEVGRRKEALKTAREAVQCYLGFTAGAPGRFVPDLAESLRLLANRLEEAGVDPQSDALVQKGLEMLQRYSPPEDPQAET